MKILYIVIKTNIKEENIKNNPIDFNENNITWKQIQNNFNYKSILLLLSYISELTNIIISKEVTKKSMEVLTKYGKSEGEISKIYNFLKLFFEYITKLNFVKNLYTSNLNKNTKMENLQLIINDLISLIQKSKLISLEIIKDYNTFKEIAANKNKNNNIIYGYNILEKYSLYEKYIVGQENINAYDEKYYNNYGGGDYCNNKIKYTIKLNKKYRNKMKFIYQLSNSLISYSKGIHKINKEKFIQNIRDSSSAKKTRLSSQQSTVNSANLKYSNENDYSSIDYSLNSYKKSFLNSTRNNSGKIMIKSLNVSSEKNNNIKTVSNQNLLLISNGFDSSSNNNGNDIGSLKNSVIFQKKLFHQKEIKNLIIEKDFWSSCSLCCKNIQKNIVNEEKTEQ